MKPALKILICVSIFSIAMAALESAVVVYLRELYYPDGFTVVFRSIDENIVAVELLRELGTLVMLGAVGYLAGKEFNERFAYFLTAFAVWDIFYYVWLKALIDWPASIFEWDILFLIPFAWLGPVYAPIVCSVGMLIFARALLKRPEPVSVLSWLLLFCGSLAILYTFMVDYGTLITKGGFLRDYPLLLRNRAFLEAASRMVPQPYDWVTFTFGMTLVLTGILLHSRGYGSVSQFTGLRRRASVSGNPSINTTGDRNA